MEDESEYSPNENEHESQAENIGGDEEGQFLVIHRVMLTPKASNDDICLRRSLFCITCTTEGKLCSLVIDSGSTENFVSQGMVNKLNLKT